jgi:WD40 repeat protein/mono/diheme cytochrome c family protein
MRRHAIASPRIKLLLLTCPIILFPLLASTAPAAPTSQPVNFARDMAPILVRQCQRCHGPEKAKGKYRLDTLDRLKTPGSSKEIPVVPGKPDQSEIYRRLTLDDEDERMPHKADRLPDSQIAIIGRWIEQGALSTGIDSAAPLASLAGGDEPSSPDVYARPFPATAVAFCSDGAEIAVSGYHEVTVWGPGDGKLLRRIGHLPERIWGLAYSPDGSLLAVAGGAPGISGAVILCDAKGGGQGEYGGGQRRVLDRIADMMLAVSFSPDGKRLAAGGADNIVRIFDVATGKRELLIEQHADWVTDLAFSPDGTKIVTASRDKSARVFDAKTGAMESAYLKHEEAVTGVCWSPDGKQVYTAGRDRKVHAWDPADAKAIGEIAGFDGDPFKIAAAPSTGQADGLLLVCSSDGLVRSYAAGDRKLALTFERAPDWVYCLSVDAKDRRVAGGCYNGEVLVWDLQSGKIVSRFIAAPR